VGDSNGVGTTSEGRRPGDQCLGKELALWAAIFVEIPLTPFHPPSPPASSFLQATPIPHTPVLFLLEVTM
jgi:hypothetical protein